MLIGIPKIPIDVHVSVSLVYPARARFTIRQR